MRKGRGYLGVVLLFALVLLGCASAPREPMELTILHTNDVWGYVDPCG